MDKETLSKKVYQILAAEMPPEVTILGESEGWLVRSIVGLLEQGESDIMTKFNPNPADIKGEIKASIKQFVDCLVCVDDDVKKQIKKELGDNYYDNRIDIGDLLGHSMNYAVSRWLEVNIEIVALWKKVLIENASVSNKPHMVANAAIKEFKKQFKREE